MSVARCPQFRLAAGLIAVVGALALGTSIASAASTDFTWSGGALPSSNWSLGGNWVGGVAPSGSVGTLTFPALTLPSGETTEPSSDDLTGLSADEISIDDGTPYVIGATGGALALGSGGLAATTSATAPTPPLIDIPITLASPQVWSVDGGAAGGGGVLFDGSLSGSADALEIDLSNQGQFDLGVGSEGATAGDNEVGDVTITGADSTSTGVNAYANGAVAVAAGAGLDATDGSSIQLTDAGLFGDGTLGSVSSSGGVIAAGEPLGVLSVNGNVTLDSSSELQFAIADSGSNPGTDFSVLGASGNVDLGGATLDITGGGSSSDCPTFTGGFVDTLLATSGTLTGTFANALNGAMFTLNCSGSAEPQVQINYTANTVTATVLPVPTATTLAANPQSATTGQSVTLTAAVNTAATFAPPAGTVAFEDGGLAIAGCDAVPVSAPVTVTSPYTATCAMSTDLSGLHTLTATFDPANPGLESPSTSPAVTLSVSPAASAPSTPPTQTLAVFQTDVSITGHGKVSAIASSGPVTAVASCPGECSGTTTDLPVTLAAAPAAGWFFKGWGGACSGMSTCAINGPGTSANVTATFTEPPAAKPPPAPTIRSITIKGTTATFRLKQPRAAAGLQCALVRDPTGTYSVQPKPSYTSCTTSKIYRHLHTHTSYTVYVRAVSHSGHSKPVSRRFSIHS